MVVLTRQEKGVLMFIAFAVFLGSIFVLVQKRHPAFLRVFYDPIEQFLAVPIEINSASQDQWQSLPGIGPQRAQRIVEARRKQGGFASIEDVRYVKGIGPYVFNQIRPYLVRDP